MFVANTYSELLEKENLIFVDVRSESEYNKETIPNSINIPILNDSQRVEVSTIYDNGDQEKAKQLAARYASEKLEHIYITLKELSEKHNVCLFCQRGSLRSTVLFNMMKTMGLNIYKLKGGYKSYRRYVIEKLEELINSHEYVNINGFTGVGKTEILNEIEKNGNNVLNLEKLANHRGSTLGNVGLGEQPTQKMFESLLLEKLMSFDDGLVFVESESSKIGSINVPKNLRNNYNNSPHQVMVYSDLKDRIERIKADYITDDNSILDIENSIDRLSKYIGKTNSTLLKEKLSEKNYDYIIENLIVKYYDINYSVKKKDFEFTVNNDNSQKCANEIMNFYKI